MSRATAIVSWKWSRANPPAGEPNNINKITPMANIHNSKNNNLI